MFTVRSHDRDASDIEGQLYTLGLLEELRAASKDLWGASSAAYFRVDELLRELGNPNLHEIFPVSAFRVEFDGCSQCQYQSPSRTLRSAVEPHPQHVSCPHVRVSLLTGYMPEIGKDP